VSITFVHYLHTKISTVDDISPSINTVRGSSVGKVLPDQMKMYSVNGEFDLP